MTIPVSNLAANSSVVIRPTSSFDDLFIDPFTNASSVILGQTVKLRPASAAGVVEITCTYRGAGALSAHEWDVSRNTQPGVVHRLAGDDIRFLPDEAAYLDVAQWVNPPWLNCGGSIVIPRAGFVPMRRINAYIHPQSDLFDPVTMTSLQEFKGVNYPVDEVHLESNAWGDINWSHLVESGFTGPVFTGTTSPPITSTSFIEFDDVWRYDCNGLYSGVFNARFPIRTQLGASLASISLWGYADRPTWQGPAGVADQSNVAYYWLPPEQPWFAFDRSGLASIDTSATMPSQIFRRATWNENVNFEYPLIGGRGIMTNLDASATTVLRWVRPLTYPGDLRRDAR